MFQAITTKYLGPTNTKGSRIKATCNGGSLTLGIDNATSVEENHRRAAVELAMDMGWYGRFQLIGGSLPKDAGYAFTLEAVKNDAELLAAAQAVVVDLERFASKQGPGPDLRLERLKTAISSIKGESK